MEKYKGTNFINIRKRYLSILLVIVFILGTLPDMAWADDGEQKSVPIYLTVSAEGQILEDKSGELMVQKKLDVTDKNGDNKLTIDDVMLCAHEQYYSDGTEGYASSEGTATKLWGIEKGDKSILFRMRYQFNALVSNTAFELPDSEIEKNFQIFATICNEKDTSASSFFVANKSGSFLSAKAALPTTVVKGKDFSLKLAYFSDKAKMGKPLTGYEVTAYTMKGESAVVSSSAVSDSAGKLTVNFPTAGTYVLTAKPSQTATIKAAVPACLVNVLDNTPKFSKVELSVKNDMSSLCTLNPIFDKELNEYTLTIPEDVTDIYSSIYMEDNIEGLGWSYGSFADNKWTDNGLTNSCGVTGNIHITSNVSNIRIGMANSWNPNEFINTFTIAIKRMPVLTNLTVDGFAKENFDSGKNSYSVIIKPTQENIDITPVAKSGNSTITIDGKAAVSGQKLALPADELEFDAEGQAKVPIVMHNEDKNYVDNTYTLILKKEPTLEKPTILLQPVGAEYLQNDTALALEIYASAGGKLQYQWYKNAENNSENGTLIEGANATKYVPTTEVAGKTYYYCVATNTDTGKSTASESTSVVVEPDPTPIAQWDVEVPEVSAENKELFGEYTHGFYYKQGDTEVMPLKVTASSIDLGGEYSYQWYIQTGTSTSSEYSENYTPKTDQLYGLQRIWCEVQYTYKGKEYITNLYDSPIAVYVDKADIVYPEEVLKAWSGSGTEENPWQLASQADLTKLKDFVGQGYDFAGMYFKMTGDISLDSDWDSIGGGNSNDKGKSLKPFSGVLDGGNFTLTYAEGTSKPLFRYVRESTVHNLKIYAPYFKGCLLVSDYVVDYGVDGDYSIGTGGSYAQGCPDTINIENVTVKNGSYLRSSGFIDGGASGGNTVNIRNCVIEKGVTMGKDKETGDIVGNVASFAGRISGSIINCVSYADLYSMGSASGIVAGKSQSMGPFSMMNCGFCGSITSTGDYVGGIIGKGYLAESAPNTLCVTIQNCYVDAVVKGANYVGGLFGAEPGCIQNWSNSYIRNNHFYGTVEATAENANVGSIIGYMASLNKCNVIENNYYREDCGAERAIGRVGCVDTSCTTVDKSDNQIKYIDTSKSMEGVPSGVAKPNYNRTDDPMGADSVKLARKATASEMADGTTTALLNKGEGSLKNWINGGKYPVFSKESVAYALEISGDYKDTYYIGDKLDLSGISFIASLSDGTTKKLSAKDVTITGFDSSKRSVLTLVATYGAAQTGFTVTVLKAPVVENKTITVYFTLLGDSNHGENGEKHTLRSGNLETWIKKKAYTVDVNARVRDVFEMALKESGIKWENPTGNYVSSITYKGVKLAEFTNGQLSGWMYTLNGTHPSLGLNEQFLENGDNIVWHYTDDYTKEEGSEKWGGKAYTEETETVKKGAGIKAKVDVTATVSSDGKATVKPAVADIKKAIEELTEAAKKDKSSEKEVILNVTGDAKAKTVETTIPKASVAELQRGADRLTINTSLGEVSFDADILKTLVDSVTADFKITIAKTDAGAVIEGISGVTEEAKTALKSKLNGRPVYDFSALSGSKEISQFKGKVNMSLSYTPASGEQSEALVAYWVKNDGSLETVIRSGMKNDGKHFDMEGNHWSTYAIGYNPVNFSDTVSHWAKSSIMYLAARDVIKGKSEESFAPNAQITRAEFIQILANMSRDDLSKYAGSEFSDVSEKAWYAKAVAWAVEKGIASGTASDKFSPNANITRQDMSVMISKYVANVEKEALEDVNKEVKFSDSSQIASYAKDAVTAMQKAGIINGVKNSGSTYSFNPKANATRAEASTMIANYMKQ